MGFEVASLNESKGERHEDLHHHESHCPACPGFIGFAQIPHLR
jgi:hypothetical protein